MTSNNETLYRLDGRTLTTGSSLAADAAEQRREEWDCAPSVTGMDTWRQTARQPGVPRRIPPGRQTARQPGVPRRIPPGRHGDY